MHILWDSASRLPLLVSAFLANLLCYILFFITPIDAGWQLGTTAISLVRERVLPKLSLFKTIKMVHFLFDVRRVSTV